MRRLSTLVVLSTIALIALHAQEVMRQQIQLSPSTGRILQEIGIILQQQEGQKQPSVLMKIADNGPKGAKFQEGDVLVAVNKKEVKSLKEFDKAYEAVKVGAMAEFEIERGGKKLTLSFVKPKPQPRKQMTITR
jgi:S1-C subfamily serine protease